MSTLHVGIDDTDSPRAGCTTYVASLIVPKLLSLGASLIDYPNLIRLNPNVPWKTRGNGALCLRFKCNEARIDEAKEIVVNVVEKNSDLDHPGTEPGVVFFSGSVIPDRLSAFSKQAIQGIVKMKDALTLASSLGAEAIGFKTGRGVIGALAAVGENLIGDHTYELIAYRVPPNRGSKRQVDKESVLEMDRKTKPFTYNNVDLETGRVLITPHGPDPILYGIRGQTADVVRKAHGLVRCFEPVERWTIFRTNQGTDAHLRSISSIEDVKPYRPVVIEGAVSHPPRIVPRRHVVFSVSDGKGQIDCAAYEPTGDLRKKAVELILGDAVEAFGGVRPASVNRPVTVNLEKFRVLHLAEKLVFTNPLCPHCGRRMESMGAAKGFRCDSCGLRSSKLKKQTNVIRRNLEERLYVTSLRSQRHLTKPLSRYGVENSGRPARMVRQWFWINNKLK
jgi:tRNA(Ile2)-agmatinylcytidine synthase